MIEPERFWPYWGVTKALGFILAGVSFALMAVSLLFSGMLDHFSMFGFPLGVLLSGQFVVFLCIGLMFWFTGAQDRVDAHYGANEDL